MPANDSPFWDVVILAIVGLLFVSCALIFYKNEWAVADWISLGSMLFGVGGALIAKRKLTGS